MKIRICTLLGLFLVFISHGQNCSQNLEDAKGAYTNSPQFRLHLNFSAVPSPPLRREGAMASAPGGELIRTLKTKLSKS